MAQGTPQEIILKPIVTEASMDALGEKKYTFKVLRTANKIEIGKAVEILFGVEVAKVNTMNVKGQQKRQGRSVGYRPDWKKAIVTLKENSKGIEFFETMM